MELDSERTEVLIGAEKAAPRIFQYFANATKIDVCLDSEGPALAMQVGAYRKLYLDFKGSGRKMRCITEITKGNVADCKELMKCARVRHLDDMKGNFSVSQKEYVASSIIRGVQPMPQLIYSNSGEIVAQNQSLFDTLWNKAIPAAQRIREIEESKPAERTEVIYGQERIMQTLGLFLDEIESEVRVIVPQPAMLDYLERLEIFHHLWLSRKKRIF